MRRTIPELLDTRVYDTHERYDAPSPVDNCYEQRPPKLESDYYCRAIGRWGDMQGPDLAGKWKYCYARAGAGTNHVGHGRCRHHGGSNPNVENRYSELLNDSIGEKLAKFLMDPNPLDLRAELAAARALFEDFVERHESVTAALLAWHASFDPRRRGLHDAPLYHFEAIRYAFEGLVQQGITSPSASELQAALEAGVELARHDFLEGGGGRVADLKVEKPVKVTDITNAVTVLKTISSLATTIIKHEQEAFLSVFAVRMLIEAYGEQTRKTLAKHLRRLGVNDGEEVEAILRDIARGWESTPALETSIPRLVAERQQQDEYLGS